MFGRLIKLSQRRNKTGKFRYSTLSDLLRRLQTEEQLGKNDIADIENTLKKSDEVLSEEALSDLPKLFKTILNNRQIPQSNRNRILSKLLSDGIRKNFSLYFLVPKKDFQWSPEVLAKVIEANPGRVDQAWDLYERHAKGAKNDILFSVILKKILEGEKAEIESEEFYLSISRIARAIYVIRHSNCGIPEHFQARLFNGLVDRKLLSCIGLSTMSPEFIHHKMQNNQDVNGLVFLRLFKYIFRIKPYMLSVEDIIKAVNLCSSCRKEINEMNEQEKQNFQSFSNEYTRLDSIRLGFDALSAEDVDRLGDEIFEFVQKNKLDRSSSSEINHLRIRILEYLGIHKGNITAASNIFESYRLDQDIELSQLRERLLQIYCFTFIKNKNRDALKLSGELSSYNPSSIESILSLILANSILDFSLSLQIFNESIGNTSKKLKIGATCSDSGLLVLSLILASLYNHDRGLASFIYERAQANNLLVDLDLLSVKKYLRSYPEVLQDQGDDKAKKFISDCMLDVIRTYNVNEY